LILGWVQISLSQESTNMSNTISQSLLPVYEWESPKFAIMGGFSLDKCKYNYQTQYLKYLETLAKAIPVKYFANKECQGHIESEIDVKNIEFVDYQLNSLWIRDYAPIWLKCKNTFDYSIVNFPYGANHFDKSPADDEFSSKLSEHLGLPLLLDFPRKHVPYYFEGGNIFFDENFNCYTSIREEDPPLEYRKKLLSHINCQSIVVMNAIPGEPTGHVDMFMKLLPEKRALLAQYCSSPFREAMDKNKEILNQKGIDVIDIPHIDKDGFTNWSYANAVIVNGDAFVPQYGHKEDESALRVFADLGYSVHPVAADTIMKEKGSLHCITNFIYK